MLRSRSEQGAKPEKQQPFKGQLMESGRKRLSISGANLLRELSGTRGLAHDTVIGVFGSSPLRNYQLEVCFISHLLLRAQYDKTTLRKAHIDLKDTSALVNPEKITDAKEFIRQVVSKDEFTRITVSDIGEFLTADETHPERLCPTEKLVSFIENRLSEHGIDMVV